MSETTDPEIFDNGETCYGLIPADSVWVTVGSSRSNTLTLAGPDATTAPAPVSAPAPASASAPTAAKPAARTAAAEPTRALVRGDRRRSGSHLDRLFRRGRIGRS